MEKNKKFYCLSFFILLSLFFTDLTAQHYPDTLWMPVTFYDFRSDKSNPDFEASLGGQPGMIADTLSNLHKPIKVKNQGTNKNLDYWFIPSGLDKDANHSMYSGIAMPYDTIANRWDSTLLTPNPTALSPNEYISIYYDSSAGMENIVIYDSLPFLHVGGGIYAFEDETYFPLDGRGFDTENFAHNYSFSMELHTTFKYKPGIIFNFAGNDDAFVFINGELVMDLGGIHDAVYGTFDIDTLGLTPGSEYSFEFFYAERHSYESIIQISTNIISTHIASKITIEAEPADATIPAGDSVKYSGTVWYDSTDGNGVIHTLPDSAMSEQLQWSFTSDNPLSDPNGTILTSDAGSQTIFTSTEAYETFTVTATYEDPVSHVITSADMQIFVIAGPPDHIVVEASPDTTALAKKQDDTPIDTLVIAASAAADSVYAIIRDQYGNFVNYDTLTSWNILSGNVIASITKSNISLGEGKVQKSGPSGTGLASATTSSILVDSLKTDSFYVTVLNDAPIAANDAYSILEDQTLVVPSQGNPTVLANDYDNDPLVTLTATLVTNVSTGTLNFNSDGSFTYIPEPNFTGTVQFTYKAFDGEVYSNVATVTILIGATNDAPVAVNDSYLSNEDTQLTVDSASGILINDSDPEGTNLTAKLVESVDPSTGTLTLNANGSFVYNPATNFNGITTFTYQAYDGVMYSQVATVTITVTAVNDTPIVVNDFYTVNEDDTLSVTSASGILINDGDVDGDVLTINLVSQPNNGTISILSTGAFTYIPDADFNGLDTAIYNVSDGSLTSSNGLIIINVLPLPDMPTAINDNYTVAEDDTLKVTAPGVLSNDISPDGSPLSAIVISSVDAGKGSLSFDTTGAFVFIPTTNFNGSASFTYQCKNSSGFSQTATVFITVSPVNDTLNAIDDFYAVQVDDSIITTEANGVLANDFDIDNGVMIAAIVDTSGLGATGSFLSFNNDGTFKFNAPSSADTITFTYMAMEFQIVPEDTINDTIVWKTDTIADTATVTITVTAAPIIDPITVADTFYLNENTTFFVPIDSILSNDTPDTATPILVSTVPVEAGVLTFDADSGFTFVPSTGFTGATFFTYQTKVISLSNISPVVLIVQDVNDAPTANNDAYFTNEDIVLSIPNATQSGILANDNDPDGDTLSAILTVDVDTSLGVLALQANGFFTFTPKLNTTGSTSFKYIATDGSLYSDTATVTITVTPVNDGPLFINIPNQTIAPADTFSSIALNDYISDVEDPDSLLTLTVSGLNNITITIDASTHIASITINDSTWTGSDTVTFTVADQNGLSATETVIFTVTEMSKLPLPEANPVSGIILADSLDLMLYVSGHSNAKIYYTYTIDGTIPADPTTGSAVTTATDTIDFGPFTNDSIKIIVKAFAVLYPYINSEVALFEYLLAKPKLPAIVANPDAGAYKAAQLSVSLSTPNIIADSIWYTTDGTDPKTSGTKQLYTGSVTLGPITTLTDITLNAYAVKKGYIPSEGSFIYSLYIDSLLVPIADPKGKTFDEDTLWVKLSVTDYPDALIKYSLNSDNPTENGIEYTDSIAITSTTTLKAVAYNNSNTAGPIITEIYTQSLPNKIKIYPDTLDVDPFGPSVVVTAGDTVLLVAKILDIFDSVFTKYLDDTAPITWKLEELDGNNTGIFDSSGFIATFIPIKAHNTVKITVSFEKDGIYLEQTITLIVAPGAPDKLWLEGDPDRLVSPNNPAPLDTVIISSRTRETSVYAVLRDKLGNWVATSKVTTWNSSDNTYAEVNNGITSLGEGIISLISSGGPVIVTGQDIDTSLSLTSDKDSVVVKILDYWYYELQIVVNDTIANPVDTLIFNTNIDSAIQVFGHRDDDSTWEKISGNWSILDNALDYIIAAPGKSHEYFLSPLDTATGRIAVKLGNDTSVTPDTVFVKFTPGGPTKITIELITPDDSLIAGSPIKAVIKLYNGDNKLIHGDFNLMGPSSDSLAIYADIFSVDSSEIYQPKITVDDSTYNLKHLIDGLPGYIVQSITGAIDTVTFTLYNVKDDDDSLHQLSVDFGMTEDLTKSLFAETKPFKLLPMDSTDKIILYVDNIPADTVHVSTDLGELIQAVGYDPFGNLIGPAISNWSNSNTITDILFPNSKTQIFYEVSDTLAHGTTGFIYAVSTSNLNAKDTIFVIVTAPSAQVVKLLTQDENGDGYLDAFILTFDVSVELDSSDIAEIIANNNIVIENGDDIFTITNIEVIEGTDNKQYKISVDNSLATGDPQTDWKPEITILGLEQINIADVDTTSPIIADDGAAPVIWQVINKKDADGKVIDDEIQIIFSENIKGSNGLDFNFGTVAPEDILQVWVKNSDGTFEKIDTMLTDIGSFTKYDDINKTLTFKMENGKILGNNFFISLKDSSNVPSDKVLMDGSQNIPNIPDLISKKVQVIVSGVFDKVTVGPNPATPSHDKYLEFKSLPLQVTTFEDAKGWVDETGGMIIAIDLDLGLTKNEIDSLTNGLGSIENFIDGSMMIFDVSGNLVYQQDTDPGSGGIQLTSTDIEQMKDENGAIQTSKTMVFYWHGYTGFGMPAKPGVYKALFYFQVKGRKNPTSLSQILAITK